jgi:hypothetical protein
MPITLVGARQAYDLVMKVAAGEPDQVEEIVAVLQGATVPRH